MDWIDKKLKQFVFETKVLDEQNRIIEMIGSTEDFDRVGDRMFMNGVVLDNYLKNPIILPNHDYHSQAIGKSLSVTVVGSKLIFKIQFADTELGREWFYLYANKFMNASSIGFIGLEYKPNSEGGYDFLKWELLELSLVTVPCNPNAIQRAYEDKKISKALFDLINKNNEGDTDDMKVEEVQKLIDKAVDEKVKALETKHSTEMTAKVKEIEDLNDKVKELEDQVKEKAGASLSKATLDCLCKACDGISEHVKSIKDMCDNSKPNKDGEEDDDEEKEYSQEDIQKMVAANIEKLLKEAK